MFTMSPFLVKKDKQDLTYLVDDENGLGDDVVPDWETNDLSSLLFIMLLDAEPAVLHPSSSSLI